MEVMAGAAPHEPVAIPSAGTESQLFGMTDDTKVLLSAERHFVVIDRECALEWLTRLEV